MRSKILYIGLSRTGTTSLHHILLELGLSSCNFCRFLLQDTPNWQKCEEFDALGDTPIPYLYKELDRRFPGSRFLLTIRERDPWLESMKWLFSHGKVIFNWDEHIHEYHERFYGTRSFNKRILSEHWERYHNDVFNYFSDRPEDLLTIKLEEGFMIDEICAFLNLPFRDIPSRKMNSKRNAKLKSRIMYYAKYPLKRIRTKCFTQRRSAP